jgi:serine/threonine protein kinase
LNKNQTRQPRFLSNRSLFPPTTDFLAVGTTVATPFIRQVGCHNDTRQIANNTMQDRPIQINDVLGPSGSPLTVVEPFITAARDPTPLWIARDANGNRLVVRPLDLALLTEAARQRWDRLSRLQHPNLVKLDHVFLETSPAYSACELILGVSLQTFLDSKGLGVVDVVYITRQLLLALDAVHEAGITHGQLAPSSVVVESRVMSQGFGATGVVKLAGLDRPQNNSDSSSSIKSDLRDLGRLMTMMLQHHDTLDAGLVAFLGRINADDDKQFDSAGTAVDALDQLAQGKPRILSMGTSALPEPRRSVCHSCKADVVAGDNFCTRCGSQVSYHIRRCNSCGGYPDSADLCCTRCGSELPPPVNFVKSQ